MMYRNQCTAKEKLMNRINEVSFAVNDVLLYLDTHPCCEEAISFYQECEQERQKLLKEYAQCYGPLTVDAALESGGIHGNGCSSHSHGKRKEGADSLCGIMKKDCSIR